MYISLSVVMCTFVPLLSSMLDRSHGDVIFHHAVYVYMDELKIKIYSIWLDYLN